MVINDLKPQSLYKNPCDCSQDAFKLLRLYGSCFNITESNHLVSSLCLPDFFQVLDNYDAFDITIKPQEKKIIDFCALSNIERAKAIIVYVTKFDNKVTKEEDRWLNWRYYDKYNDKKFKVSFQITGDVLFNFTDALNYSTLNLKTNLQLTANQLPLSSINLVKISENAGTPLISDKIILGKSKIDRNSLGIINPVKIVEGFNVLFQDTNYNILNFKIDVSIVAISDLNYSSGVWSGNLQLRFVGAFVDSNLLGGDFDQVVTIPIASNIGYAGASSTPNDISGIIDFEFVGDNVKEYSSLYTLLVLTGTKGHVLNPIELQNPNEVYSVSAKIMTTF